MSSSEPILGPALVIVCVAMAVAAALVYRISSLGSPWVVPRAAIRAAIKQYESLGADIVEVSLPHTEHAVGVYYIVAAAECSANLARFDGVRYGHRAAGAASRES